MKVPMIVLWWDLLKEDAGSCSFPPQESLAGMTALCELHRSLHYIRLQPGFQKASWNANLFRKNRLATVDVQCAWTWARRRDCVCSPSA